MMNKHIKKGDKNSLKIYLFIIFTKKMNEYYAIIKMNEYYAIIKLIRAIMSVIFVTLSLLMSDKNN